MAPSTPHCGHVQHEKSLMMRNQFSPTRVALLAALAVALPGGAGRADDARSSFEVCHFGAGGGGCTHFQGYVYVHPDAANAPAFVSDGKAAAESGRLYIHVDGDESR
jgi:hypothetical protein